MKCCQTCGQPLPKLLEQFPGETDQEYALRLRREYRRETRRPRRSSPSETVTDEDVAAVLHGH